MGYLLVTLPIVLILFSAAFVQSVAGFGYGLVAVPLLTAFCMAPEIALPLSAVTAISQSLYGVIRFRKELDFRGILPYSLSCNAGMIVGVLILKALTSFNADLFGVIIGGLLLMIVAAKALIRPVPGDAVSRPLGIAVVFLGGFICGLAGVGGPIIVLWTMAHNWDNRRIRGTLWSIFLFMTVFQIVMYIIVFGNDALQGFVSGLVIIPVVLLAAYTGLKAGNRLNKITFSFIVTGIIVLAAVFSIVKPYIP